MDDPSRPTPTSKPDALVGFDIGEYLDADARSVRFQRDRLSADGFKAMMLAPSIEVCRALLRGERIYWGHLDYHQAERYGLKHRRPDGRYFLADFNDTRRR